MTIAVRNPENDYRDCDDHYGEVVHRVEHQCAGDDQFRDLARRDRKPAVDLLAQAISRIRPMLAAGTTKHRIRLLWAAANAARNLGAWDVLHDAFMGLAVEVNLIDGNGWWTGDDVRRSVRRFGAEDVSHAITWALRGWTPFE